VVQRILNILNKEFVGIHQAAYLLGVFAIASQILALFRDRLLANIYGAGSTLDVYYAAFRIPDFLYITIASFVSITVLIPFLVERLAPGEENGGKQARAFLNSVFTVFILAVGSVSALAFFLAPELAKLIVPGFGADAQAEFVFLTRILLFSPIILGVSSLLGSVTQTYRKFFVFAGAPVLYNLGIIVGIVFFAPVFGIEGVVYGVIVGAVMHLLVQIPVVARHSLIPRITPRIQWNDIKAVVALSLPRTVTLSATHVAFIVLLALASLMTEGSIAIFNFSFNLQSVPLSIIGVSYSVAAFPTLARFFSTGQQAQFVFHIASSARHIIFWSIPAIVLFVVLRAQIVRTILGSGEFDWSDTRLTAAALAVFALSVTAHSLMLLFVRGYYAAGKTKGPLIVNVLSSLFIVVLGFVLVRLFQSVDAFRYFFEAMFRIEDLPGTVVVMLPLAYSIGMTINGLALFFLFRRDFKELPLSLDRVFWESFGASIIMGFVAYRLLAIFGGVFDLGTFLGIFLQGLCAGIGGLIVGAFVLKLLRNKEMEEIFDALHQKFKGTGVQTIAADQEEL